MGPRRRPLPLRIVFDLNCINASAACSVFQGMKPLTACLLVVLPLVAQDDSPSTYRLQVRIHEPGAESSPESQTHILLVQAGSLSKLNASRRLPHYTARKGEVMELHTIALGSIVECKATDTEAGVDLDCAVESSYVEPGQEEARVPLGFLPAINSRQIEARAVVPLGREVHFAQLDDPTSGNRLEIFVKAERLQP